MNETTEKKEKEKENKTEDVTQLRVKSKTPVKNLAGAVAATMKDYGVANLHCIGDGAIGRGLRAAAIAGGYLKPIGIDLIVIPSFGMTEIDGNEKTKVILTLENR